MNIKKIIREEMDDLDWIRDVPLLSFEHVNNKALEFDPPITNKDYWDRVKSSLVGIGCTVRVNLYGDSLEVGVIGLFINNGNTIFTLSSMNDESYVEHISGYAERDVEILDGRYLIPQ